MASTAVVVGIEVEVEDDVKVRERRTSIRAGRDVRRE